MRSASDEGLRPACVDDTTGEDRPELNSPPFRIFNEYLSVPKFSNLVIFELSSPYFGCIIVSGDIASVIGQIFVL